MAATINPGEYELDLCTLRPGGETSILKYHAQYDQGARVAWTLTACCGPLYYDDFATDGHTVRSDWVAWAHEVLDTQKPADRDEKVIWAAGRTWNIIASYKTNA